MAMNQPSLQEFLDQADQINDDRFVIDDEQKANWALRKIKSLQDQKKENIDLAEAEIARIDAWLDEVNGKVQADIDYFQGLLSGYALQRRENDPKFKSLKLPYGKIGFRKQQPKWEYEADKVVKALKQSGHDDLVRVKEEPDKTQIKKRFKVTGDSVIDPDTGEILDGVKIEHREDSFNIEVF